MATVKAIHLWSTSMLRKSMHSKNLGASKMKEKSLKWLGSSHGEAQAGEGLDGSCGVFGAASGGPKGLQSFRRPDLFCSPVYGNTHFVHISRQHRLLTRSVGKAQLPSCTTTTSIYIAQQCPQKASPWKHLPLHHLGHFCPVTKAAVQPVSTRLERKQSSQL